MEVKQARLWEHSNISLSLLRDKTFKGKVLNRMKKSQLINVPVSNSAKDTETDDSKIKTPIEANVL